MPVRKPHVAGTFYPDDPSELREFCQTRSAPTGEPVTARAIILPHAGYIYSGKTAGRVFGQVRIPTTNFLIGPNHSGIGSAFSLVSEGDWETPLGRVPIETRLASRLLESSPLIEVDESAHRHEHSLEVEIPFLQVKNRDAKIVPLIAGTLDLELARETALALAGVLAGQKKEDLLVVVSTDMSHYEADSVTRKKDRFALEAIEHLDAKALVQVVRDYRITMCGFIPVYMFLMMSERLGIKKARLVEYTTSAEASGDTDRVVGYAGFIFE